MSASLVFSAIIVGRLSRNATAAAAWILKGITPGTDEDNNLIKKIKNRWDILHTQTKEREREGNKRKKGKVEIQYRGILSAGCWMLALVVGWLGMCVVLKLWRRYMTGCIVDSNFVFFFFFTNILFFFGGSLVYYMIRLFIKEKRVENQGRGGGSFLSRTWLSY
jgi:hypothetical protein